MKKYILLIVLVCLAAPCLMAQRGALQGTIMDKETGEALIGANVVIKGTTTGISTDVEGKYEFTAEPGVYVLQVTSIGYQTIEISDVEVNPSEATTMDIVMEATVTGLQEVVIQTRADRTSNQILTLDRKKSDLMVQNIGAMELSRIGAGDAAGGLKKIVGLSMVGSKYVYVRGLGDRYNTSSLNDFPIASPDPDKRVVPFDIFSTSVIENMTVVKAYNPQFYADFSGGAVQIETKNYPSEPTLQVGFSAGFNTQSTFDDFQYNNAQNGDVLGFRSDLREIPSQIPDRDPSARSYSSTAYDFTPEFGGSFSPLTKRAPLNKSFNLLYGNYYDIGRNSGLGVLISLDYSDQYEYRDGFIKFINVAGGPVYDYDFQSSIFATNKSGLGNLYYKINNQHNITFTTLHTHLSNDDSRETRGFNIENTDLDPQTGFADADDLLFTQRYTYRDYHLQAYQLQGKHKLLDLEKLSIDWGVSLSSAGSNEPDRRDVVLLYDNVNGNPQNYTFNLNNALNNGRFFSSLVDDEISSKLNFSYVLKAGEEGSAGADSKISVGVQHRIKTRSFQARRFGYALANVNSFYFGQLDAYNVDQFVRNDNILTATNTDIEDGYVITEQTFNTDGYQADLEIYSAYGMFDFTIIPKVKLGVGARIESAVQGIDYRAITTASTSPPLRTEIEGINVLPMANVKYDISENTILRATAARTISRPDFIELPTFQYVPVFGGVPTRGNPILTNSDITNLDLRVEKYYQPGELIAIGAFSKWIDNPIESVFSATGTFPGYIQTYANTDRAYLYGVEIEARKKLDFINPNNFFKDLSISTNITFLKSEVTVGQPRVISRAGDSDVSVLLTNDKRPLVGASPYLFNLDLSYERTSEKLSSTWALSYNVYGERIVVAGVKTGTADTGLGDVYELPVNTLNLTIQNQLGLSQKYGVNFSAVNLLNPSIRTEQATPAGDDIELNTYKRGVLFKLGVTYNIL